MNHNTLQEISKISINITRNEETFLTFHNSVLSVRTDKGIHFLEFGYNLHCLDKVIDFVESSIPTPNDNPAAIFFSSKLMKTKMSNSDFTQMLIDPTFWPYNDQFMRDLTNVTDFKWSPQGLINGAQSAIAVLNNLGNVELFGPQRYNFVSILKLTTVIKDLYMNKCESLELDLDKLKQAVYAVETSAVCWEPAVNADETCHFVTAQKDGNILFWSLQCKGEDIRVYSENSIQNIHNGEIVFMLWIPKSETQFWLVCSNVFGQIFAHICEIEQDNIKYLKTVDVWSHKDKMIGKHLTFKVVNEKTIFICNKHRHLLVIMLDDECRVVQSHIQNVNEYRITSICKTNNSLYLSTINCNLYEVFINVANEKMEVRLENIFTKDDSIYEMFGFGLSTNEAIFALGLIDRRIKCKKEPHMIDIVFFSKNITQHTELPLLLNNPSQNLTHLWDCIELLRYKTMKLKELPTFHYKYLYENDLYKLKIYLILLTLYNKLDEIAKNGSKGQLPETSKEVVQEKISVLHAKTLMYDVYDKFTNNGMVTSFDMESYDGAKRYLQYYFRNHKKNIEEFVSNEVLNFRYNDSLEKCMWCENTLEGISCENGHPNVYCSVTFTQIINDEYIVCKSCGSTARIELKEHKQTCIFCDLYMSDSFLPS